LGKAPKRLSNILYQWKLKFMKKNAFYAQSGGVTAVINTSASGVIEDYPPYKNGLPWYPQLKNILIAKRCKQWTLC
jgi:hypothetical protein